VVLLVRGEPHCWQCAEEGELLQVQLLQRDLLLAHVAHHAPLPRLPSMAMNATDDLEAFFSVLAISTMGIILLWAAFSVFRLRYPLVYSGFAP